MKLEKLVAQSSRRLARTKLDQTVRRLNWSFVAEERITRIFKEFVQLARKEDSYFHFFHNIYGSNSGEPVVQLSAGINKTDCTHEVESELGKYDKYIYEKGACLCFSQSVTGSVMVVMYPYKSERMEMKDEYLILHANLDPVEVSSKLIKKCILRFLNYAHYSSLYGDGFRPCFISVIRINWYSFIDIKNRRRVVNNITRFVFDHYLIVLASLASASAAYMIS